MNGGTGSALGPDEPDQDAEPTMTAPEDRPDADASQLQPDGRADSPHVADADG